VAAPKKGRSQQHPGRALVVILLAIVALVGGMFLSGTTTPRLGIDLAGGTSITLTAKNEPGQKNAINKANMDTAVNIIERRVNGVGVTEAEVQTQGGSHIIVNIPKGTNEEQAKNQVGRTARLFFRPVLQVAAATPPQQQPGMSPSPGSSSGSKGKATPGSSASPSGKASKAASTATAKPGASSTTQGRVVSQALTSDSAKAGSKPTASATATATGKAAKSAAKASSPPAAATPPPAAPDSPVSAALQKKFSDLKCTGKDKPPLGQPAQTVVACGTGDSKDSKFILGPVAVDGTDLSSASAMLDQQSGQWQVNLEFTGKGSGKFQKITGTLAKKTSPLNQFAIVLDGDVVSHPQVNSAIGGGRAQITGSFTHQQASDLSNILSYGALPLTFRTDDVTEVSAALGSDQLQGGLIAGAIGMVLVILYSLLYYRGLAFVSICSLAVSAVLTYSIMTLLGPGIGFALNLPAVCGAIVAIGITADSFIVYFERIRDEIREGRSLRPSVERAWPRARRTILVSDFVSFLAAAVLYIVSVGKVQGFAFTLGLTTLLDVVVVFLFTKPLMTLLARTRFFGGGHKWSGLDPKRLGAKPAPIRGRRRPATPLKES
jgi:preprotein translocase subunit SecD